MYRSGKSYLCNQLLDDEGKHAYFGVGTTVQPHSQGVWAYPYEVQQDSSSTTPHVILFLDSVTHYYYFFFLCIRKRVRKCLRFSDRYFMRDNLSKISTGNRVKNPVSISFRSTLMTFFFYLKKNTAKCS